jgi:hypothetical protein
MQSSSRFLQFAALLFLIAPAGAIAQNVAVGGQFMVGVPTGEFSERLDGAIGYGLTGQFIYHIPRIPVGVGAELGFLVYGQETIRERFGSGGLGRVEVDVITTNNIGFGHLLFRLQPPAGTFRPYADGLIGLNYLFTQSRIQDVRGGDRPEIAASTNFDDIAFSFGGGAGFQALLLDRVSETGQRGQLLLDVRLRYMRGQEADYLKRGSIRETATGELEFDVERSRTDLLMPQVGVSFRF